MSDQSGSSDDKPREESAPQPAVASLLPHGGLMARLRAYFLAGILVTAPIGITIYLAVVFIGFIDRLITPLIPAPYNPATYLPFSIPGLGLIILLVALTMIGALTAGLFGRWLVRTGERILNRMPVVRSIYGATKQIFETVLAQQSSAFREAVLVEYPRRGLWTVGFITGRPIKEIQRFIDDEVVNVFIPTIPNPTSGFLLFVPRKEIRVLDIAVEDAVKMVISGGIILPPARKEGSKETNREPAAALASADRVIPREGA